MYREEHDMTEMNKVQEVAELETTGAGINVGRIVIVLFIVVVLGITFLAMIGPSIGTIYTSTGNYI